MKLEHLEYFSKITSGLSLTANSQTLHISQQGLSTIIINLEKEFGCELIMRTGKGIYFTPIGEKLAKHISEFLSNIQELHSEVQHNSFGSLKVIISENFIPTFFQDFIGAFINENPQIDIQFTYGRSFYECFNLYTEKECDLFFTLEVQHKNNIFYNTSKLANDNGCSFNTLFSLPTCVIGHKDYLKPYIDNDVIDLKNISHLPLLANINSPALLSKLQETITALDCTSNIICESNHVIYMQRLQNKQGFGLDTCFKSSSTNSKNIIKVPLNSRLYTHIGYIARNDLELSPLAEKFISSIMSSISSSFTQ